VARDVCVQLEWQDKRERLQALGVIFELQRRISTPLAIEHCHEDAPGIARLCWRVDAVSTADQLQREIADLLEETGWGRHRTPIAQFDA
jgi:hypothetical protein